MNTSISKYAFNALFVISLVLVFFIIENRFEELEMESVYQTCVADEHPIFTKLRANDWVDLCKLKIEHEYNRSL